MGFGALIIGDEIIRGKRQDKHLGRVIEQLRARGLTLDWATYVGDQREQLAETLRRTLAASDVVFSFGGIGATPDDHTRQAAAMAAGVELQLHAEAAAEIRAKYGEQLNVNRLHLAEFPVGSRIIPNPVNRVPGFSFADHHFVPGFPQMAGPMVEWVLDHYYRDRFHRMAEAEASITVWEGNEGVLIDLMQRIEIDYPAIKVFSLPSFGDAQVRRHLELGVRGDPAQIAPAMAEICAAVRALGLEFDER
jgi:molybdopterin-biosynthesis enzyme MoeA-like protein